MIFIFKMKSSFNMSAEMSIYIILKFWSFLRFSLSHSHKKKSRQLLFKRTRNCQSFKKSGLYRSVKDVQLWNKRSNRLADLKICSRMMDIFPFWREGFKSNSYNLSKSHFQWRHFSFCCRRAKLRISFFL